MGKKMNKLADLLQQKHKISLVKEDVMKKAPTPIIFNTNENNFEQNFSAFLKENSFNFIEDAYENQLEELFCIRNPSCYKNGRENKNELEKFLNQFKKDKYNYSHSGCWVYYPWTNNLVHFLEPDLHQEIRTARNKLLVTTNEQEKFRKYTIGIGGLSIGNSVALSISYS